MCTEQRNDKTNRLWMKIYSPLSTEQVLCWGEPVQKQQNIERKRKFCRWGVKRTTLIHVHIHSSEQELSTVYPFWRIGAGLWSLQSDSFLWLCTSATCHVTYINTACTHESNMLSLSAHTVQTSPPFVLMSWKTTIASLEVLKDWNIFLWTTVMLTLDYSSRKDDTNRF